VVRDAHPGTLLLSQTEACRRCNNHYNTPIPAPFLKIAAFSTIAA